LEELFAPLAFILIFFVLPRVIRALGTGFFRAQKEKINEQRQRELGAPYEEKYGGEEEQRTLQEKAEEARAEDIFIEDKTEPFQATQEEHGYLDEKRVYTEEPLVPREDSSQTQMDPERDWSIDSDSTWGDDWKSELAKTKAETKKQIEKIQREIEEELETRDVVQRKVVIRKKMQLGFSRKNIIQGVIFSEFFAPPRARRKRIISR